MKQKERKDVRGTESITCDIGDGQGNVYHDMDQEDYYCHVIPCQYCDRRKQP